MKKPHWAFPFLRRAYSFEYLVNFYIASIVSLLFTRLILLVFNYPIIGRGGWHLSHSLDGGLLMFIALLLQILFVDKRMMRLSSVLGGLGFGRFIDEVGKFMTRDNDYFYRPAVAIIYFFYLLLFLILYKVRYSSVLTQEEKAANAVVLPRLEITSIIWKMQHVFRKRYRKLAGLPVFQVGIQAVFFTYVVVVFINMIRIAVTLRGYHIGVAAIGQIISNSIAAVCIVIGVSQLKTSRMKAYKWYQRAILIWIFFTQFFVFYEDQFSAVIYLGVSLLLLAGIRYMIDEERSLKTVKGHALSSS